MNALAVELISEDALVARAQTDRAAFAEIYDHFFRRVYNYARYRVGDPEAADDVTAQVFERALQNLHQYRAGRAPFAAWLFGIARHAVQDHLRQRARRPALPLEALATQSSDDSRLDEEVEAAQAHDRLLAAMGQLKEREREIVALKFGAGLSNRRIAELTGLSESNVGVILYRAIRALRRKLGAEVPRGAA